MLSTVPTFVLILHPRHSLAASHLAACAISDRVHVLHDSALHVDNHSLPPPPPSPQQCSVPTLSPLE